MPFVDRLPRWLAGSTVTGSGPSWAHERVEVFGCACDQAMDMERGATCEGVTVGFG